MYNLKERQKLLMNYEVNIDPGKRRDQMFYPEPPTMQSSISV